MTDTVEYKPVVEIEEIIYEFNNNELHMTCGLYHVKVNNGTEYYFLRNDESVGVIQHLLGRTAKECICPIRNDVKKEFFIQLNRFKNKELKEEIRRINKGE